MVFPVESENQVRRRVLDICQDQARKVLEAVREAALLVDSYGKAKRKELRERHLKIQSLEQEAVELKRTLTKELTEAGALLLSREDILRVAIHTKSIADYAEAVASRLVSLEELGWNIDRKILRGLVELSQASLETVTRLREIILTLSLGPSKTMDLLKGVEKAEAHVDELYRKLEIEILRSGMDVPTMLVVRDIAFRFEEMADMTLEAADDARILSLGIQ